MSSFSGITGRGDNQHGGSNTTPRPAVHAGSRIGGLDGLRAIAIAAVLLFHADFYWARGGYLGVDLFFVLSGFLITGLMADEIETGGRLNLGQFYWRRAKRLLPAAWLMMATVAIVAGGIATDALPRLRAEALASLFYVTNWELLSVHVSYFEATGRQPLLQHLWSLAIEEQYYIAWALLVPLGMRWLGRKGTAVAALAMAAGSAAWMAVLAMHIGYPDQGDPSRLYFGTDTHGFQLLLGSALALVWRPARLSWLIHPLLRAFWIVTGIVLLAALLVMCSIMGEEARILYPWGLLLAGVTSVGLIAVASHPALPLGHWLDNPPMRWLGNRSYGIYLWHWPIYMLMRPGIDWRALDPHLVVGLRLALSIAIAALSYRYLEMPIRRGALKRIVSDFKQAGTRRSAGVRAAAITTGATTMAVVAVGVLWRGPAHDEVAPDVRAALHMDGSTRAAVPLKLTSIMPLQHTPDNHAPAAAAQPAVLVPVQAPELAASPEQAPTTAYSGKQLTAVGDSVLLGSSPLLVATLHGTDVHATVGWQAADVLKQVKALHKAKQLREVFLIHLGTNGYVYEDQLRAILSELKDCKQVILMNSHVPRRWMEANNVLIDRLAPEFPNVLVVRWSDLSENQPDYFVSDGVHLTDRGQRAFIASIMRAGHLLPDASKKRSPLAIDPGSDYAVPAGDGSATLVLAPRPAPADKYWLKLARCETDADWQGQRGASGGLAITAADWLAWGGSALAARPSQATQAQQIEVANRISTQGWTHADGSVVKPVGFSGWRCVAAVPPPPAPGSKGPVMTYTAQSVLAQSFHLGERGTVVRDLQIVLGLPDDGIYSRRTRAKHLLYLKKNGVPVVLAGANP